MKLINIKLANFRGFHNESEISFGPHLTVLFGRNGFGKSTVMDAFEWLLHGQILRYLGDEEGRKEDYVKHVDAEQEPYVEVSIEDQGQGWVLRRERRSKERSELRVQAANGSWLPSAQAHDFLSRLDADIRSDPARSFIFSEPFVAYHLLGQQSIQDFVQSDPRERYELLAPIIGVERYVRLTEALLQSRRTLSVELEAVDRTLNAKKEEISAFQQIDGTLKSPEDQIAIKLPPSQEWLDDQFRIIRDNAPTFLRERLPQRLPVDFGDSLNALEQILPSTVFWISARQKELEDRLASLQELGRNLKETIDMNQGLSALTSKFEANRNAFEAQTVTVKEKDQAAREVQQSADQFTKISQQIAQEQATCLELTRIQQTFDGQALHIQSLQTEASTAERPLIEFQNTAKECLSLEQKLTFELQEIDKNNTVLANSIALADSLIASIISLAAESALRQDMRKNLDNLKTELARLSAELLELEGQSKSAEMARKNAAEQLTKTSSNAKAYQNLLAQIRQFIETDQCPVCSTRFESRDALLERIDSRLSLESPALSAAAQELDTLASRIEDLRQRIETLRVNYQTLDSRIKSDIRELDMYDSKLALARQQAIGIGVFLGSDLKEDAAKIQAIIDDLTRQKSVLLSKGHDLSIQLKDAQLKLQQANKDVQERQLLKERLSASILEATQELEKVDLTRLRLGRSLGLIDISPEAVASRSAELTVKKKDADSELKRLQERLATTREALKKAQEDLVPYSSQQDELTILKSKISRLEAASRERASSLGVKLEATESFGPLAEGIVNEIASIAESKRRFDEFSGSVRAGKQKLKLDEQNAKLTILETDMASLERKRTTLVSAIQLTSDLAEKVRKAGEARTQRILTSCATLAENYYNRIYSHPLWSRLDIGVDDDPSRGGRAQLRMVAHRTTNRGKSPSTIEHALSPISIKYSFSTGQLNLFAISLVLSLAQQRSDEMLSMLMLDDPVQAMDDMRVAELCWVLLQLARNRQIIIATGNENFVELLFNRAAPIVNDVSIVAHLFQTMTSSGPQIQSHWRTTSEDKSGLRVA